MDMKNIPSATWPDNWSDLSKDDQRKLAKKRGREILDCMYANGHELTPWQANYLQEAANAFSAAEYGLVRGALDNVVNAEFANEEPLTMPNPPPSTPSTLEHFSRNWDAL